MTRPDGLPAQPFHGWHDPTEAGVIAAAQGQDPILDDVVRRTMTPPAARDSAASVPRLGATAGLDRATRVRFRGIHYLGLVLPMAVVLGYGAFMMTMVWVFGRGREDAVWFLLLFAALLAGLPAVLLASVVYRTAGVPRGIDGARLRLRTLSRRVIEVDLDQVTMVAYTPNVINHFDGWARLFARLIGPRLILVHPAGHPYRRRQLRNALRPVPIPDAFPEGGRATVVLLNRRWAHEVLRPVSIRLAAGPAALSPHVRTFLAMVPEHVLRPARRSRLWRPTLRR